MFQNSKTKCFENPIPKTKCFENLILKTKRFRTQNKMFQKQKHFTFSLLVRDYNPDVQKARVADTKHKKKGLSLSVSPGFRVRFLPLLCFSQSPRTEQLHLNRLHKLLNIKYVTKRMSTIRFIDFFGQTVSRLKSSWECCQSALLFSF